MWVIYQKKERKIVGMSADCEVELDRGFALEEVVKGLVDSAPLGEYDAIQVSDREAARALLSVPCEWLVLRKAPKGKLQVAAEEPRRSFLLLGCDALDAHPVDGIPEISADGESFTTITVQKLDERGELQQGEKDNDLLYLRTDYGALFSADGKEEITSIKLKKRSSGFSPGIRKSPARGDRPGFQRRRQSPGSQHPH